MVPIAFVSSAPAVCSVNVPWMEHVAQLALWGHSELRWLSERTAQPEASLSESRLNEKNRLVFP